MLSRAQLILTCLAITLLCSCSDRSDPEATSDSEAGLAILEMPTAAHFITPDGASLIVARGIYEVDFAETSLMLIPDDDALPQILIIADRVSHDENIDEPTAAAYPGETDEDSDILEIAL